MDLSKIWSVSTSGDCEGKSTKQLGIYKGDATEIAFYLAGKSYYDLFFKELKPKIPKPNTNTKVDIHFIDSNTTYKGYLNHLQSYKNIKSKEGPYYNSIRLTRDLSPDIKKQKALSKLSSEDREVLGV